MRGATLFLLFCARLAAQQASFEGVAVNAANQQPLSGVHVRLVEAASGDPTLVYGAMSDQTGHFSIAGIRPGSYTLTPRHAGFVYVQTKPGGPARSLLRLAPGQHLVDFKLEMTPHAVIAGRVVDEYGDPLRYVSVAAVRSSPDSATAIPSYGIYANTDDRGEFRISGEPGKYYVQATPEAMGPRGMPPEVRTDGTTEAVYGPTYYPSATGRDQAAAVEAAGGVVTCIEIRLLRQRNPRSLTISGVVMGNPESTVRPRIMLESHEREQVLTRGTTTSVGSDGRFSFPGLQPGLYRLFSSYSSGRTQLQSQTVDITLDSADVTNLALTLTPLGELAGTLEVVGNPVGGGSLGKRRVLLQPVAGSAFGNSRMTGAEVDGQGAFLIGNLAQARFRVRVEPLTGNDYIKTVQLDGVVAANGELDFSHGVRGSTLKITISRDGGQISGTVQDRHGEPLVDTPAVVLLFAYPDLTRPEKTVRPAPDAKYSSQGIRPGKYRLLALEESQAGYPQSPDAWKALAAAAEEIEIKEGDRISKDLKVLVKEDANAKPKQ